jgi:heat shock protein HslJ
MNGSGRKSILGILPLLLFVASCDSPVTVVVEAEPEEVETCEWLIPIGIELVNDYFYTLEETDLGVTGGDVTLLPTSIVALNTRGEELDRRAAELGCDLDELNRGIVGATEGLESTDPVVQVFLETVRAGLVGSKNDAATVGEWRLIEGSVLDEPIQLAPDQTITLIIDDRGNSSGYTGCNEYDIDGLAADGSWPVTGFGVTDAPCPSDVHSLTQDAYLDALLLVTGYTVADDSLVLSGPTVSLRFAKFASS